MQIIKQIENWQEIRDYCNEIKNANAFQEQAKCAKGRLNFWLQAEPNYSTGKYKRAVFDKYLWKICQKVSPFCDLAQIYFADRNKGIDWHKDAEYTMFQRDEKLYERAFAETLPYFYHNRDRVSDWQSVIIYPSRSTEQKNFQPYSDLLNGDRVHRIYLNELGNIRSLPIWVALMVLTTIDESQAPEEARYLLRRTITEQPSSQAIIELITTIMVYKFEHLSQKKVETMLGITLQETRVYRQIKAEGREEGLEQGRGEEAVNLVIRQLTKRFGRVSEDMRSAILGLSLDALENLSEALLDFTGLDDLKAWLVKY